MDKWKRHNELRMPPELSGDEWVEVRCLSGAVNLNLARNILWDAVLDCGEWAYWTVTSWRRATKLQP